MDNKKANWDISCIPSRNEILVLKDLDAVYSIFSSFFPSSWEVPEPYIFSSSVPLNANALLEILYGG